MASISTQYRPEIDGLRAIAVLLVLLNHAEIPPFAGGYLGVDVFFVISGYLITNVILQELEVGSFNYKGFLERRARRILPALFAMLMPVTLAASYILDGRDRDDYFRSLVAVSSFWPNIRFFLDVGYFDVDAAFKPLLHTWSLGVEEQFYLILPFLLVGLSKRSALQRVSCVLILAVASFLTMMWVSRTAAFYLLPSRAWELLCGSLIVLLRLEKRFRDLREQKLGGGGGIIKHLDALGVAAIIIPSVILDKSAPWPSVLTLAPVLGAVLVLVAASPDSTTGKLLSNRPVVVVGLCSYSIYLWHHPLFSLFRYRNGGVGWDTKLFLVFLSLVLGWCSWRYIELLFKVKKTFDQRRIFVGSIVGCSLFLLIGGAELIASGGPDKVSGTELPIQESSIVLIGDSHAGHLVPGLSPHIGEVLAVSQSAGCVPLWRVDRFDYRFKRGVCARFVTQALRSAIDSETTKVVVLASMGPVYMTGEAFRGFDQDRVTEDGLVLVDSPEIRDRWKVFELGLRDTLQRLELAGKRVVVVVDVPELGILPQNCEPSRPASCQNPRAEIDRRSTKYRELIRRVSSEFLQVTVFDPTELFCNREVCTGLLNGRALYDDVDHLNEFGSQYVGDLLGPLLLRLTMSP